MSVLVVGVSHNSAPVPLLERVAPQHDEVPKLVQAVLACEHVTEATVIATCNRVEIYADVDRFHGSVEELSRLLVERSGETTEAMLPHLYVHYDDGDPASRDVATAAGSAVERGADQRGRDPVDVGLGAGALADTERLLEEHVERRADGAELLAQLEGVPGLAEIWPSPTAMESRPAATWNRCETAPSS